MTGGKQHLVPSLHPEPPDAATQRSGTDNTDSHGLGGYSLPRKQNWERGESGKGAKGGTA